MTIPKRFEELLEEQNQEKLATTVAWPELETARGTGNAITNPVNFNSSGQHPGANIQVTAPPAPPAPPSTPDEEEASPEAPKEEPKNPLKPTPGQGSKKKWPGLNLNLDIAQPITNLPTSANPRSSSVNDRLVNLINDMTTVQKTTSWE
jgi:hypothetical protein